MEKNAYTDIDLAKLDRQVRQMRAEAMARGAKAAWVWLRKPRAIKTAASAQQHA